MQAPGSFALELRQLQPADRRRVARGPSDPTPPLARRPRLVDGVIRIDPAQADLAAGLSLTPPLAAP